MLTPLGAPTRFAVESLNLASLPEKDKTALLAYQKKAGELQRAMMGTAAAAEEALKSLSFMRKALIDTPKADPKLMEQARTIEVGIRAAIRELMGDSTVARRSEARLPSLMERVGTQTGSTGPVTQTVLRDYEIAADGFGAVLERLRGLIERDLRGLAAAMEAAGAPWTRVRVRCSVIRHFTGDVALVWSTGLLRDQASDPIFTGRFRKIATARSLARILLFMLLSTRTYTDTERRQS